MKAYQIYFSPTGGTRKVSELITDGFGIPFMPIDLLKNTAALEALRLEKDDICLFALPSFGGRIPSVARPVLERLRGNGARAILVAVFGNRAIDDTLAELQDLLTASGFHCAAGIEAVAEHSLCRAYGAGRPDPVDAEDLRGFARQIAEALSTASRRKEVSLPGNRPYRAYGGVPFKPTASDRCNGCGRCAEECPAEAIPVRDPRSTDANRCISCMHCVSVCPVNARSLPAPVAVLAKAALAVKCSGRKPNRLYL